MATGSIGAPLLDERAARSYIELVLEGIALRHQIAVLKRSGTRRPYFRLGDRLFWMLLSWLWSGWRTSLMIVQPETVLRWRRQGGLCSGATGGGDTGGVDVRESRAN